MLARREKRMFVMDEVANPHRLSALLLSARRGDEENKKDHC